MSRHICNFDLPDRHIELKHRFVNGKTYSENKIF